MTTAEVKLEPLVATSRGGVALRRIGYLLMCTSALATLWAIHEYGVDVPYYDDWNFTGAMLDQWLQGKLPIGLLFAQNMEHRVLLPRLMLFGLALITHWRTTAGMYANFAIVLAAGLLLVRLAAQQAPWASLRATSALILMFALLFGLIQWEIWLWSASMQIVLIDLLLVIGISVARARWRFPLRVGTCAFLALVATYSSGNGFLLWILLPPILLLDLPGRKQKWLFTSGWLLAAAGAVALYFVHYTKPQTGDAREAVSAFQTVAFLLRYLGASVAAGTGAPAMTSLVAGTALLCVWIGITANVARRPNRDAIRVMLPWICLGAYAIATGVMISFARASSAATIALSSRYIGYSVYLPISLLGVCAVSRKSGRWSYSIYGFMIALLALHLHTTVGAMTWLELARSVRAQARCTLRYIDLVPTEQVVGALSPQANLTREQAHRLDRAGYLHPSLALSNDVVKDSITSAQIVAPIAQIERVGNTFRAIGGITPELGRDGIGAVAITVPRGNDAYEIVGISASGVRTDTAEPLETLLKSSIWHAEFPSDRVHTDQPPFVLWAIHSTSFRFTRIVPPQ